MPEFDSTIEYRDVPGFPGYRAGSDGSVWSCRKVGRRHANGERLAGTWRQLKPGIQDNGAQHIAIRGRFVLVHHLVLLAFVGPCPPGLECCHADDDRGNNCLSNLRWDTHQANCEDRDRNGKQHRGERHGSAKLTDNTVRAIQVEYAAGGISQKELALKHRVSQSLVSLIVLRKIWTHLD